MDVLDTLGVALGLAALAGINLYLTVFATGLAVHFGWVALPASLHQLSVLGDPWVVVVAGVLYFLEFFADKIPWIDSVNDSLHTFIRPLGAALLAVLALGDAHPGVKVIAALLAGGVALTSHVAKTGTRLVANTSPEPVSNIGLSLGEDAMVLGGLALVNLHPAVAFFCFLALIVILWVFLPKLLRSTRSILWLAWRKLNQLPEGRENENTLRKLPDSCELLLRRAHATTEDVVLAVPCLSGSGPRLPANRFGWLVKFAEGRVFFVSPQWMSPLVLQIPMEEALVRRESRFLSEKLIVTRDGHPSFAFVFERGHRGLADRVADGLVPPQPRLETTPGGD